jgi:hypothetical protein
MLIDRQSVEVTADFASGGWVLLQAAKPKAMTSAKYLSIREHPTEKVSEHLKGSWDKVGLEL